MPRVNEQASVGYYNSQPGILTGGGVLIFNQDNDLLLVKPSYRNTWAWPGGGWDPGESPKATVVRECREEIGVCPVPLLPAFVNYIPPREDGSLDVVHFVFTTHPVENDFLDSLTLQADEIEDIKFVPKAEWGNYMKEYRVRAVETYLQHKIGGAMLYLEDGLLPAS